MFTHPGKKLLFMGNELAVWREWNHDGELDWAALDDARHAGMQRWVRDLNSLYTSEPALWDADVDAESFHWIDCHDHENSVISFVRFARDRRIHTVAVINFTPRPRTDYRIGVPDIGFYRERLNSDSEDYGGSNVGNLGQVEAVDEASHGFPHSMTITVPPLACVIFDRGPTGAVR
jgi:1,4-alpha-glucan branching enzyme